MEKLKIKKWGFVLKYVILAFFVTTISQEWSRFAGILMVYTFLKSNSIFIFLGLLTPFILSIFLISRMLHNLSINPGYPKKLQFSKKGQIAKKWFKRLMCRILVIGLVLLTFSIIGAQIAPSALLENFGDQFNGNQPSALAISGSLIILIFTYVPILSFIIYLAVSVVIFLKYWRESTREESQR